MTNEFVIIIFAKASPQESIMSQISPNLNLPTYFFIIYVNIRLPSNSVSSKWSV
jgi:hypothetical protein